MFDNFSYLNKGQPKVEKVDEEEKITKSDEVPKDEIKNKQKELIEASKNQHFKEKIPSAKVTVKLAKKTKIKKIFLFLKNK